MKNLSRRMFLKTTTGILGGLAAACSAGEVINSDSKKENPVKDKVQKKEYRLTEDELKRISINMRKDRELSMWMDKNFDGIFDAAPNNELYAVGVYREPPTLPEVHYFNNKHHEVLPFMKKCYDEKDLVINLICRHQKDVVLIL